MIAKRACLAPRSGRNGPGVTAGQGEGENGVAIAKVALEGPSGERESGMDERDKLRARFPSAVARAPKSKAASVKLFCIECMGGSSIDAGKCTTKQCFLWPHAFKRQRQVG